MPSILDCSDEPVEVENLSTEGNSFPASDLSEEVSSPPDSIDQRLVEQLTVQEDGENGDPELPREISMLNARLDMRSFNERKRQSVIAMIKVGISRRQAARHVGCHHSTIARAAARDPRFAALLIAAEHSQELDPLSRIIKASQRSWRANAWLLERTMPEQYGRRRSFRALGRQMVIAALDEMALGITALRPDDTALHEEIALMSASIIDDNRSGESEPEPPENNGEC